MHLKSEGFASNLYDPEGKFTLEAYCAERDIPYGDIGVPVAIETFIAYGLEFQRRWVPEVENVEIISLKESGGYFELTTSSGEILRARRVVIAAGIVRFAYLPPLLAGIPGALVSHSSQHSDLSGFKGRKVAVLGAGASALDIAALLLHSGAEVELVARRQNIPFHDPPNEPRPLLKRLDGTPFRPRDWMARSRHVHGYSAGFSRNAAVPARQGRGAALGAGPLLVHTGRGYWNADALGRDHL